MTAWTLGDIKRRNLALEGYCQGEGCGHFYVFKLDDLIASAGLDYIVPEILPGVTCTACGGPLEFKLAMMSPADAKDTASGGLDAIELLRFHEAEAEDAYTKMYDATDKTTATAHYSNAKEALHTAIGLAIGQGDSVVSERLEARLAHVKAVFRSQFS
jgi:hypothetical protein